MSKKIIAISAKIPSMNQRGDQLVSFKRIIFLSKHGYSIDCVCFKSNDKNDNYAKRILEKNGVKVHFIKYKLLESIWNLFLSLFDKNIPFQCAFFKSKSFEKKIKNLLNDNDKKLIYCVKVRVTSNINWFKGNLVVDLIDSMSLNFKRRAKTSIGIVRWIFKKEQLRIKKYEKFIANKSRKSFVTSEIDKKEIGSKNIRVIPNGVDLHKKIKQGKKNNTIVFTGNMFYQPNIDAILWFVNNCWSIIIKNQPKTRLLIVGNNPKSKILSLSKKYPSIKVTGTVPSVKNILNKSTIAIAPMQSGSGIQNKILEAMSCSVPVVSTTMGLGGIKAKKNKDLLIADTAKEFSKSIILLLRSNSLNKFIGNRGRQFVLKEHNWNFLNIKFKKYLIF